MEKNIEKNVYMCIIESFCYTAEIGTTLQISYTPNEKAPNKSLFEIQWFPGWVFKFYPNAKSKTFKTKNIQD